jgi:hypothetical protein
MLIALIDGYHETAEWLLLFAAIFFVAAGALAISNRPDPSKGALVAFGLGLLAIALLVV